MQRLIYIIYFFQQKQYSNNFSEIVPTPQNQKPTWIRPDTKKEKIK